MALKRNVALAVTLVVGAMSATLPLSAQAMETPNEPVANLMIASLDNPTAGFDEYPQLRTGESTPPVQQIEVIPGDGLLEGSVTAFSPARLPVSLRVGTDLTANAASIYINGAEVIRFRADHDGKSAKERAEEVLDVMTSQLSIGEDPASIKPVEKDNQQIIQMGEGDQAVTLLTVDEETAKLAGQSVEHLGHAWSNQLRAALGAEKLSLPEVTTISPIKKFAVESFGTIRKFVGSGMASWYGPGFHGRRCANGSRYNMYAMTAAHKTLPFGTKVLVKNRWTGKSCVVVITDRGPYAHGRIIDLSKGAAQAIGLLSSGVAPVSLEILTN